MRQLLIARSKTTAVAAPEPQVTIASRTNRTWGFGTAVLVAPKTADAYPEGWLFIAYRDKKGWTAALEGEPAFADLAGKAAILAPRSARSSVSTAAGPRRRSTGAPACGCRTPRPGLAAHRRPAPDEQQRAAARSTCPAATAGCSRPAPGSRTRCARPARAGCGSSTTAAGPPTTTTCPATSRPAARRSPTATFLGNIGNDVTCGGSSTGAHVHFSLRCNNKYVRDRPARGRQVGDPAEQTRRTTATRCTVRRGPRSAGSSTTTAGSGSARASSTPTAAAPRSTGRARAPPTRSSVRRPTARRSTSRAPSAAPAHRAERLHHEPVEPAHRRQLDQRRVPLDRPE